jgi:hypothetical protein
MPRYYILEQRDYDRSGERGWFVVFGDDSRAVVAAELADMVGTYDAGKELFTPNYPNLARRDFRITEQISAPVICDLGWHDGERGHTKNANCYAEESAHNAEIRANEIYSAMTFNRAGSTEILETATVKELIAICPNVMFVIRRGHMFSSIAARKSEIWSTLKDLEIYPESTISELTAAMPVEIDSQEIYIG